VDAREWDYPTGYNLEIVNRHIMLGEMLRGIVRGSGIIANELSARVDELVSLPWKFVLKNPAKGVKSEDDPRIKELNAFFKMPDRKIPYPQWMEMIFRERYTIDAATVYIWKNRTGTKPYALEVIDGNTIVPKIDDRGRIPDWPSLAYTQIVKGLPMDNFTEREIVYMPRHRWAQMPIYGYSEVEQILMEATQQVRKTMYMLNFWCYSDDTEALTRRGWLPFDKSTDDDEFATRNPDTHEFEWQKPTAHFSEHYEGDMVHIKGRSVDLLVTPHHRVLLSGLPRKCGGNPYRKGEVIVKAQDLVGISPRAVGIPITSKWQGQEIGIQTFASSHGSKISPITMSGDQFCAFMGMWLSEGSKRKRSVQISQRTKSKGYIPFRDMLIDIFGEEPYYNGCAWELGNKSLRSYMVQFGLADGKFIPESIMGSTPRQIEIFLHYFYLGDGAQQTGILYTNSFRMAGQFVELAQKTGCAASWSEDDRRTERPTAGVNYGVRIRKNAPITGSFQSKNVEHSGRVSCVSVPNGILFVRRKGGNAVWCGNTEGTCPDVMVCCPENWTAEQIALWQGTFDALMSGNLKLKSKMRFIPGGGKPFEMKGSAGDLLKSEYDEWMARIVCRAFRTDPKPYIKEPEPRANSEQLQEQMRAQGLNGEMLWWSSLMERLIFLGWGWGDIGHAFDQNEEVAATDQATIDQTNVKIGARTINELRDRDGLDAIEGGDVAMIYTGTGAMPLSVLAAQTALPTPVAPGGAGGASGPGKNSSKPTPTQKEAGTEADRPLAKRGSHWSRY
jgi:hypothetical protein